MRKYETNDDGLLLAPKSPAPSPDKGEVLLRVICWGVPPDRRYGANAVGVVVAVGEEVPAFRLGDRVCAPTRTSPTNRSEYVVVRADSTAHIDDRVDAVAASLLPAFYERAEQLLRLGEIFRGEKLLVLGTNDGLALAVAQLAELYGSHVYVEGSTSALNTTTDSVTALEESRLGELFDLIVDCQSDRNVALALARLAPGGIYLSEAGDKLRHSGTSDPVEHRREILVSTELERVVEFVASGRLAPVVEVQIDFEDTASIQTLLSGRTHLPFCVCLNLQRTS